MVSRGSGPPEGFGGYGGCAGARFEGSVPMRHGDITVEVRNGSEVLHRAVYANLLAPRYLTLVTPAYGDEISMNERVALQWSPKTDELVRFRDGVNAIQF